MPRQVGEASVVLWGESGRWGNLFCKGQQQVPAGCSFLRSAVRQSSEVLLLLLLPFTGWEQEIGAGFI